MSSLAALAEYPQRIMKLWAHDTIQETGVYGVILAHNGCQKLYWVDEMIPVKDGQVAYSKACGPELWVMMLEKAWAKLYGSY